MEFEGATKKNKPNLKVGDLVFARVSKTNKYDSPLISCISKLKKNTKSWSTGETDFGILKDGNVFDVEINLVERLLEEDYMFTRLSDAVEYAYEIGHNGKIWINSNSRGELNKIESIIRLWCKGIRGKNELEKEIHKAFVADVEMN